MSTDPADREAGRLFIQIAATSMADAADQNGGHGQINLDDGRLLLVDVIHPDQEPQP